MIEVRTELKIIEEEIGGKTYMIQEVTTYLGGSVFDVKRYIIGE